MRWWAFVLLSGFVAIAFAQTRGIEIKQVKNQTTPFVEGVYRALVIGNNDYRDPKRRWKPLSTAAGDAKAVATLLKERYGFNEVKLLTNASRKQVLQSFEQLAKDVAPNDSVLVYYAGHGFMDPSSGKGYWIPVDAKGMDKTGFIRNSTIRDELSIIASRVKHTLLISDSCFSGSLLGSALRSVSPDIQHKHYYQKVAQKKSVQIIAAGGKEYVDDNYQNTGHSPFTYFLLNELKVNNKPLITASELSTNVRKAVANNVSQVPATGVLQGVGDELGEFIFLNINIEVSVEGVPKDKVKLNVNVERVDGDRKVMTEQTGAEPAADHQRLIPLPGF